MNTWTECDAYIVEEWVKQDTIHQDLQQRLSKIESSYRRILSTLNPIYRELIVTHEYYCVEMEYQRAKLAYQLGRLRSTNDL